MQEAKGAKNGEFEFSAANRFTSPLKSSVPRDTVLRAKPDIEGNNEKLVAEMGFIYPVLRAKPDIEGNNSISY